MAKKVNWKWVVLLESLKEPLRLVALAVVAWLLTVIIPQIDAAWVPFMVLALRWVDKWLHEYKSEKGTEGAFKGLVGF